MEVINLILIYIIISIVSEYYYKIPLYKALPIAILPMTAINIIVHHYQLGVYTIAVLLCSLYFILYEMYLDINP